MEQNQNRNDLRCEKCGTQYKTQQELDQHMRDKHPNR